VDLVYPTIPLHHKHTNPSGQPMDTQSSPHSRPQHHGRCLSIPANSQPECNQQCMFVPSRHIPVRDYQLEWPLHLDGISLGCATCLGIHTTLAPSDRPTAHQLENLDQCHSQPLHLAGQPNTPTETGTLAGAQAIPFSTGIGNTASTHRHMPFTKKSITAGQSGIPTTDDVPIWTTTLNTNPPTEPPPTIPPCNTYPEPYYNNDTHIPASMSSKLGQG